MHGISRRGFLKLAGIELAGTAGLAAILSNCGGGGGSSGRTTTKYGTLKGSFYVNVGGQRIASAPTGYEGARNATVYVDGVVKAVVGSDGIFNIGNVEVGKHTITLSSPDLNDIIINNVEVRKDLATDLGEQYTTPTNAGILQLKSNLTDTPIYIDGKQTRHNTSSVKEQNTGLADLITGEHTITIGATTKTFSISKNTTTSLSAYEDATGPVIETTNINTSAGKTIDIMVNVYDNESGIKGTPTINFGGNDLSLTHVQDNTWKYAHQIPGTQQNAILYSITAANNADKTSTANAQININNYTTITLENVLTGQPITDATLTIQGNTTPYGTNQQGQISIPAMSTAQTINISGISFYDIEAWNTQLIEGQKLQAIPTTTQYNGQNVAVDYDKINELLRGTLGDTGNQVNTWKTLGFNDIPIYFDTSGLAGVSYDYVALFRKCMDGTTTNDGFDGWNTSYTKLNSTDPNKLYREVNQDPEGGVKVIFVENTQSGGGDYVYSISSDPLKKIIEIRKDIIDSGELYAQKVVLHALGHADGIGHTETDTNSIMYSGFSGPFATGDAQAGRIDTTALVAGTIIQKYKFRDFQTIQNQ